MFGWYGSIADAKFTIVHDAQNVAELLRDLDSAIVYLSRYGRFDARWIDELELDDMHRFIVQVSDWVAREAGKRERDPTSDEAHDFQ